MEQLETLKQTINLKLDEVTAENDCLQKEKTNLIRQLEDKTKHCNELIQLIEVLNSKKDMLSKEKEQTVACQKNELNQLMN